MYLIMESGTGGRGCRGEKFGRSFSIQFTGERKTRSIEKKETEQVRLQNCFAL